MISSVPMISRMSHLWVAILVLLAAGCVGTDLATTPTPMGSGIPPGQGPSGMFAPNPASSYLVRGTAVLEEITPGGSLTLRFGNDFIVSNGPGIEVFLSRSNTRSSSSISLGRVKRLSGEQSYDVPSDVKLDTYNWVVIHCVPFNVTFGYAPLDQ